MYGTAAGTIGQGHRLSDRTISLRADREHIGYVGDVKRLNPRDNHSRPREALSATCAILPRVRRFVGILSMILLSHLSLGAGDFACSSHGDEMARASQSQQHDGMKMGGMHQSAADEVPHSCDSSQKQCSAPARSECCTAMASCGALFVGCTLPHGFVTSQARSNPIADLLTVSTGPSRPETPPPRA